MSNVHATVACTKMNKNSSVQNTEY